MRVARGETLSHVQVDWETPAGIRTVMVSGTTITLAGGARVGVVTFEDVTDLESARRRSSLLAEELRVIVDGVAEGTEIALADPTRRAGAAPAAPAAGPAIPAAAPGGRR